VKPALEGVDVRRKPVFSGKSWESRLSRLQVAAFKGKVLERKNISVLIDRFYCSNKTDGGREWNGRRVTRLTILLLVISHLLIITRH